MRKITITLLLLFCFVGIAFAQQQKTIVVKRTVEPNKKQNAKSAFNYLLLDAVNDSDDAYSDFEALVQSVWDKKSDASIPAAASVAKSKIDAAIGGVASKPAYVGGDTYRQSVLAYLDAVKAKVLSLEKYGVLGANAESDFEVYTKASLEFGDVSTAAALKREAVKEQKKVYERTFFIEK